MNDSNKSAPLSPEELHYITGPTRNANAPRGVDKVKNSQASYEAGFLGSKFYQHPHFDRWAEEENQKLRIADQVHHIKTKGIRAQLDREAARESAETIGLSKAAKVRHGIRQANKERRSRAREKLQDRVRGIASPLGTVTEMHSYGAHDNYSALYATNENNKPRILSFEHEKTNSFEKNLSPVSLHLQQRECFGQYRVQVVTEKPTSAPPSPQEGTRYSTKMTSRSVQKIFEAGAYVAQCHEGFTTFATLTLSRDQRDAIFGGMTQSNENGDGPHTPIHYDKNYGTVIPGNDGLLSVLPRESHTMTKTIETTMGKEASRFLDAAKKLYQRGWETSTGDKVSPNYKAKRSEFGPDREPDDFHYLWVVESPANEDGEPNPHIHLLMRWSVERELFEEWAARLEKLWGRGFAHLERIKQPKAASSYLIKAIGYAAKGDNADQGLVKGNRYSIARCSRAPAWETLATFEADNITGVIKELGYKLDMWKKPTKRSIKRLNDKKNGLIKAKAVAKNQNKPEEFLKKITSKLIACEHAAKKQTAELRAKEVHVSSDNRFSLTFDGDNAKNKMDDFLYWAAGARGWSMKLLGSPSKYCEKMKRTIYAYAESDVMQDIRAAARQTYSKQYQQFQDKCAYWKSILNSHPVISEPTEEERNAMIADKYAALGY